MYSLSFSPFIAHNDCVDCSTKIVAISIDNIMYIRLPQKSKCNLSSADNARDTKTVTPERDLEIVTRKRDT